MGITCPQLGTRVCNCDPPGRARPPWLGRTSTPGPAHHQEHPHRQPRHIRPPHVYHLHPSDSGGHPLQVLASWRGDGEPIPLLRIWFNASYRFRTIKLKEALHFNYSLFLKTCCTKIEILHNPSQYLILFKISLSHILQVLSFSYHY